MARRKARKASRSRSSEAKPGLDFNHAMIYVTQVAPAVAFYSALGFRVIEQVEGRGFPVYARLRAPHGNSTLALHLLGEGVTSVASEGVRLYFEVKNLDALCKRLAGSNIAFTQMPKVMPWGWKHAYLNDPDGHEISLYWAGPKRFQKSKM